MSLTTGDFWYDPANPAPSEHTKPRQVWPRYPQLVGVEPGGYQVKPGFTQEQEPPTGTSATPPVDPSTTTDSAATAGLDFGNLLSGTIFGLPSWIVIGAAVWFLFFRKK